MKYNYSPVTDIMYEDDIIVALISDEFKESIMDYFRERKEDN